MNIIIRNAETVMRLNDEAARLRCSPERLAAIILDICFEEDLVDAVLDGEDPAEGDNHVAG